MRRYRVCSADVIFNPFCTILLENTEGALTASSETMAATSSNVSSLCNEKETEQLVQYILSLWQQGMHGSTIILVSTSLHNLPIRLRKKGPHGSCFPRFIQGDLLLANQQALGLSVRPDWHLGVLLVYADGLFEDQQYRRALVRSHELTVQKIFVTKFVEVFDFFSITTKSL